MFNVRLNIFILFFFLFCLQYSDASESIKSARNNYNILREKFNNWNSALYGVRGYHKRKLYYYLIDLIGNDILTENDYIVSLNDIVDSGFYRSDLYNCKWLRIHGAVDTSSIKEITEKGPVYIKEVERNKYLFSLSGRVKKFSIIESCTGRTIHLFLERVKLKRDF